MGRIVWLASYPKSGNTWLRSFLHNLLEGSTSAFSINEMSGLTASDMALGWYQQIDRRPPEQWSVEEIDRMRPKVHELIARSQSGSVFCKTHSVLATIRGVPTINAHVSSGAIYIVRNPLDVVISYADFAGVPIDTMITWMAADNFETTITDDTIKCPVGSWSQHVDSWTAKAMGKVHVVRYEDMMASPMKAFSGVLKYLNLNLPRDRVRLAIKNSSFKVLRAQETRKGFVERSQAQRRFFRKGTTGQWKSALSDEQVANIVATHGEQMARFGYLPRPA
jgi:hypothetical protein